MLEPSFDSRQGQTPPTAPWRKHLRRAAAELRAARDNGGGDQSSPGLVSTIFQVEVLLMEARQIGAPDD